MKVATFALLLGLLPLPVFAGCAAQTDEGSDEEVAIDTSEAAATSANSGYFQVTRRDFRRCAAPLCGGFYVKLVNEPTTLCANGKRAADCYVSGIDLKALGFSQREEGEARAAIESGKALVKAQGFKRWFAGQWIGSLRTSEVWVGATGSQADGTFYRAADNGLRCVKAPCPSTTAFELNGNDNHNVVDVRLGNTQTPASADALALAARELGTKTGIIVAGGVALPKCLPGSNCGPWLNASEFFLRMTATEGKSCGSLLGGTCAPSQFCAYAAGDICGAADAPGTCSYRPEACIQLYDPVCGCDGNTYGNGCQAASAGVSVSTKGECPKP